MGPIGRRGTLAGLALIALTRCLCAQGARATGSRLPETPTILVAGRAGGRLDRWADLISAALGKALLQNAPLSWEDVGGPDGVTGANQFEVRAPPDGSIALLAPGAAAISWLAGDPRVKFDPARWVPLWAGTGSAVLVSRTALVPGRPLRMAAAQVVGPELAALLALDLIGVEVVSVEPSAASPLDRADVDAVLLQNAALRAGTPRLAAAGFGPVLGFGALDASGQFVRDPAFPDLPIPQELIGRRTGGANAALQSALRSVMAAASLDFALVLPLLSPAGTVAWWRRGCTTLATAPDVQEQAARTLFRPLPPLGAATTIGAITADLPVLLELRRWLSERHGWRPT